MGVEVFYIEVWKCAYPGVGGELERLGNLFLDLTPVRSARFWSAWACCRQGASYLPLFVQRLQFQNKLRASASGLLSGQSCPILL